MKIRTCLKAYVSNNVRVCRCSTVGAICNSSYLGYRWLNVIGACYAVLLVALEICSASGSLR